MMRSGDTAPALLPGPPTIAVARGRSLGEAVTRREFRRTDTLVIHALLRSSPASAGQVEARTDGAGE